MDFSKLTYTKGPSVQEIKEPVVKVATRELRETNSISSEGVSPLYQKQEGKLSTSLVFVLSGGEKKERDFLTELIRTKNFYSLRVLFLSQKHQGLQPYQMSDEWTKIKTDGIFVIEGQYYHLEDMDKVFLLSDVDEFYDQLKKILAHKVIDDNSQWIISNPCFEIWLYYCFLNNPIVDLACLKSLDVKRRSKRLKNMGQNLVNGGLNPILAFEHLNEGINHSSMHYHVDENGIPSLFATQMFEMAKYLLNVLAQHANEYSAFLEMKDEWRKKMRKD